MCGIAGVHCWGDQRLDPSTVRGLLLANELRGKDASGVAYINPDGADITIRKDKLRPEEFVKAVPDSEWQEIASSRTILLHARAKTKGDVSKNENNHPIYAEPYKWIVTHNGNVKNDDDLWHYYSKDKKRFAEVDSSAIPLVLAQSSDVQGALNHMSLLHGNATFAAWNELDKEHVFLARFGDNELYLFLDEEAGILMWSSALTATEVVPAIGLTKLRFVTISRLPEDRVLYLGPTADDTKMFKVTRSPFFLPKTGGGSSTTVTTGSKAPSTGGIKGGVKNHLVVTGSKRPDFRWERRDPSESSFRTRPSPLWDYVKFAPMRIEEKHGEFNRTANLQAITLHTAYGRWVFRRNKGGVTREFLPHKRWTKYLRTNFNQHEAKPYPELPVVISVMGGGQAQTTYDNLLAYEVLFITESLSTGKITKLYYMCPWCGVYDEARTFLSRYLRCGFCNIRSTVQPDTKEVS